MPRRSTIVTIIVASGFALLIGAGSLRFIALEKEKLGVQREGIETQRRLHFEQRVDEIKSDIKRRRALLEEKWQKDREQVMTEATRKLASLIGPERAVNQTGKWLETLDANYESADIDLLSEEEIRIADAQGQI
jgi:hypothetical protein